MHEEMYRLANSFAQEGFAVMMPDLFSRGKWFTCMRQLMADLKKENGGGVDDLLSAREWLISQNTVDAKKTAVLGLCMGGGFALLLSKTWFFQVAAPFYGQVPDNLKGACPIVASYGEKDGVTRDHLRRLKEEVKKQNIPSDIKTYSKVGHSFMNRAPNRLLSVLGVLPSHAFHDPEVEEHARKRVVAFIRTHID